MTWKGKKHSIETRKKMSLTRKGRHFSPNSEFKKGNKYRFLPGKTTIGELNYNWKGGISSLYCMVRGNYKYRQWKCDVLTKDNYTCQNCGEIKPKYLHVHHLKSIRIIFEEYNIKKIEDAIKCEELWDINNGISLCISCHRLLENIK